MNKDKNLYKWGRLKSVIKIALENQYLQNLMKFLIKI